MPLRLPLSLLLVGSLTLCGAAGPAAANAKKAAATRDRSDAATSHAARDVAAAVDRLINAELTKAQASIAPRASDEDFLRRVSFDIAGQPPLPTDVTLFGLNPSPEKRAQVIDQLLNSPEYGRNWGRYWRDVVFLNATNMRSRIGQGAFEDWIADQLTQNRPWDQIVTDLLTATGDVRENGATALFFAHDAEPDEVAAEASRIFLGIQIQCANCHDHPSDVWKRQQFHELAAYFPRAALRPKQENGMLRSFEVVSINEGRRGPDLLRENPERLFDMLDRNRDRKLTKQEVENAPQAGPFARIFDRILENGDTNKDGAITLAELRSMPMPQATGRGAMEYYMPDLKEPTSRGKLINPKFFVDESAPGAELSDHDRRLAAAKAFTNPDNPWFARAIINRVWNEMLGEGFYMPVDDLGPTRTPRFPEVLDVLAAGFVANRYDLKWLVRTVANTEAYQRQVRAKPVSETTLPFASQTPTHLRADQLFNALAKILGLDDRPPAGSPAAMMAGPFALLRSPRAQFHQIFVFDPSKPQEDITGNVQQALFLMNTPAFRGAISGVGNSRLAQILRTQKNDQDAVAEVYLLVLAREPSPRELEICQQHLRDVESRTEAFEDLVWGLINSSEFLSKR